MGLLTFSEMQSQVRSMLGGRTDQDALIMRGLQFAQHNIAKVFHFEELFTDDTTSVSDTGDGNEITDATITMPSTLRKLHSLALVKTTHTVKLDRVGADKWEEIIASTEVYSRGEPSRYVMRGKTITLWRVPDATYTIRRLYSIWPTEIVLNTAKDAPSTTTATSLLDHKDELIITYAVVWCYLALGNREKANYFFVVYKNMLEEAGTFDIAKPDLSIASSKPDEIYVDHTVPTFGRR
jgi:hypothetical protein